MSKKAKCLDCGNCMRFAIPCKKTLEENEYLVDILKNHIVCGFTEKTKSVDNEQQCKHYFEAADYRRRSNSKEVYSQNILNKLTTE